MTKNQMFTWLPELKISKKHFEKVKYISWRFETKNIKINQITILKYGAQFDSVLKSEIISYPEILLGK